MEKFNSNLTFPSKMYEMKKWTLSLLMLTLMTTIKAQTNVIFYTTEGDFMVEIHDDIVPITGGNFLDLVDAKFYDGIIFHRVIDNFIIQGGDPTGTGTGGPGYTIEDEFDPSLSNVKKTISMANSGPDSGGSQFFFNMIDNTYLDYDEAPLTSKHAVFGIVTENFNIVEDIADVPVDGANRPITDVIIDSIRVGSELISGIEDVNISVNQIEVFPNPVNENSLIQITSDKPSVTEIQLHDSFGKTITTLNVDLVNGINQFNLEPLLNNVHSSGIYHLSVIIDNAIQTVRISIP